MFGIDEIVVYDVPEQQQLAQNEVDGEKIPKKKVFGDTADGKPKDTPGITTLSENALWAAAILQYFVTPSYLRKALFPDQTKFQYAKKLPKLPGLPFMNHSGSKYMEGLTVAGKVEKSKGRRKSKKQIMQETVTEWVNIGNSQLFKLSQHVPIGTRVTVDLDNKQVVSPSAAYETGNFGYNVRIAPSFGKVFTESTYSSGYSYTAYVPSDEFTVVSSESDKISAVSSIGILAAAGPHLLLVFGKWSALDSAICADTEQLGGLEDPATLFDGRLKIGHGFRTEDVVTVALARLKD
jgi:predicted SPOUT superfamily RNA methylase MTH1